jgi:hypothetical protein
MATSSTPQASNNPRRLQTAPVEWGNEMAAIVAPSLV